MPWDFGAGVAAAAGAGAGLIGDSIKRERNLEDATNLEALKAKVEQDKQARIAAIVGGVSRTKTVEAADESGGHAVQQAKPEAEYRRDRGDALSGAGLIDAADREYNRADVHEDKSERRDTAAAAQKSADERWRATEARQDKVWEETVRHNKALEAKAGAERISPAARAQLEMASTYVNSAHKAEAEAAKALEAGRKDVLSPPEKIKQLETDYRASKTAVMTALKQYDQIGAAHFGEQWKKTEAVVEPAAVSAGAIPPPDKRVVGQTYDGPNGPGVWMGAGKGWKPVGGGKQPASAGGSKAPAAAPGIISEPVTDDDWRASEAAQATRKSKQAADEAARIEAQRKRGEEIDAFNARMKQR